MYNKDWHKQAKELAEQGVSWRRIARIIEVPRTTVADFLRSVYGSYEKLQERIKCGSVTLQQPAVRKKHTPEKSPKILVYDIETAPLKTAMWSMWQHGVGLNQIQTDWFIMSFAAKWLGDDKVFYYDQRDAEDVEDDYDLLLKIWELLDECDIAIGHNIVKFDTKKLNARFILSGLPKPSTYRQIDTLQIAKEQFAFTSNKLEYLSNKLCGVSKSKHEKFPGYVLWDECLKGNQEAWKEMAEYNIRDIVATEELYNILSGWSSKLPNLDVYDDNALNNSDWVEDGYHYTNLSKFRRYRNVKTGQQRRGRVNLLSKEKRQSLLSNIVGG